MELPRSRAPSSKLKNFLIEDDVFENVENSDEDYLSGSNFKETNEGKVYS